MNDDEGCLTSLVDREAVGDTGGITNGAGAAPRDILLCDNLDAVTRGGQSSHDSSSSVLAMGFPSRCLGTASSLTRDSPALAESRVERGGT